MQRWVNMVELNCAPSREAEFHEWYNTIHIPDRMNTPGFNGARRYEAREARDGRGQYLAIYNLQSDDIDQTWSRVLADRAQEEKIGHSSSTRNNLVIPFWRDVLWKQISERIADGYRKNDSMQHWVKLVEVHCTPSREAEFNDWYDNIHAPDVLKTPGYTGARRYVNKEARDGRGKYLAIYHIDSNDIAETMKTRRAVREIEHKQGRSSDSRDDLTIKVWRNVLYREIFGLVNPGRSRTDSPFVD